MFVRGRTRFRDSWRGAIYLPKRAFRNQADSHTRLQLQSQQPQLTTCNIKQTWLLSEPSLSSLTLSLLEVSAR